MIPTIRYPRCLIWLLPAMLCVVSCGKKREIPAEERGSPNTVPLEQVLYREARTLFTQWLKVFSGETSLSTAYDMLTGESRRRLRESAVPGRKEFETWFQNQRHNAAPPFYYRFSRIDILDTDIRDTTSCIITATMLVDVQSQQIESLGSFTLVRERGAWRIPFAESGDWIRSWWQQERRFSSQLKDDGYAGYSSTALGLTLMYPISWDVSESGSFRVPNEPLAQRGVEFSYVDPSTQQKEALIRIWTKPYDVAPDPDSTGSALRFLEKYDASVTDATPTAGKAFVYDDRRNSRFVCIYAGVNPSETTYGNFSAAFTRMVESLASSQ